MDNIQTISFKDSLNEKKRNKYMNTVKRVAHFVQTENYDRIDFEIEMLFKYDIDVDRNQFMSDINDYINELNSLNSYSGSIEFTKKLTAKSGV